MSLYNGEGVSKLCLWDAAAPSFARTENNPYGTTKETANKFIMQAQTNRPQLNEDFGKMLFASNPTQSLRNWFQEISNSASGIGTINTMVSLRDEDVFEDLKTISVPTGIFQGRLDKICPYQFAEIQKRTIPNSKLFMFEKSGHAAFYDELEKFNRTFVEFLQT